MSDATARWRGSPTALERLSPPPQPAPDLAAAEAFVWATGPDRLRAGDAGGAGDDRAARRRSTGRATCCSPTPGSSRTGFPANNVLLWGARGMGKSSLVKAAHAEAARGGAGAEADRAAPRGPALDRAAAGAAARLGPFASCCSATTSRFDKDDSHYKSLKAVLDGGIEGRPDNVVLYATSNRRHLMPREMIENERQTGVNPSEAVEEKVSLSDRFGLWLGFHACIAGRLPRHDPRLLRRLRARDLRRGAAGRGDRVVRRPAAAAPAASPGSTSPTWRGGGGCGWAGPESAAASMVNGRKRDLECVWNAYGMRMATVFVGIED